MLKYSTGRSKPGWGKMECRPVWWPDDVPWANVRSDVRTTEQKKKVHILIFKYSMPTKLARTLENGLKEIYIVHQLF